MGKIIGMLLGNGKFPIGSSLLVQKYREAVLLDEQGVPHASVLRQQLFVAIARRIGTDDEFINAFLSTHE